MLRQKGSRAQTEVMGAMLRQKRQAQRGAMLRQKGSHAQTEEKISVPTSLLVCTGGIKPGLKHHGSATLKGKQRNIH